MAEIPGINQAAPVLAQSIVYVVYSMLGIVGAVAIGLVYYMTGYKIRMTYWTITGSGQKDGISIDKPKKARFKWNQDKTEWQMMLSKKKIEPFATEVIYPGNNVYAFKVGNDYIPATIDVQSRSNAKITPIPYHIKNWHKMQLKQNQIEFAKKGFWEENKVLLMTTMVALGCLVAVVLTAYYTTKHAGDVASGLNTVAQAIRNIQNVGGVAPS